MKRQCHQEYGSKPSDRGSSFTGHSLQVGGAVSAKPIVMRAEYAYCPNLTIIDTPGFILKVCYRVPSPPPPCVGAGSFCLGSDVCSQTRCALCVCSSRDEGSFELQASTA